MGNLIGCGRRTLQLARVDDSIEDHVSELPVSGSHGPSGRVLLLPDVSGVHSQTTRDFALSLSREHNLAVILVDIFRGDPWDASQEGATYEMWRARHTNAKVDRVVASAIRFATAKYGKSVSILGLCFGGGAGWRAAERSRASPEINAAVLCYPTRVAPRRRASYRVPTLVVLAETDACAHPTMPYADYVERLRMAEARSNGRVRVELFKGCTHGFLHRRRDEADANEELDAVRQAQTHIRHHLRMHANTVMENYDPCESPGPEGPQVTDRTYAAWAADDAPPAGGRV